jgi:hypothetical protein
MQIMSWFYSFFKRFNIHFYYFNFGENFDKRNNILEPIIIHKSLILSKYKKHGDIYLTNNETSQCQQIITNGYRIYDRKGYLLNKHISLSEYYFKDNLTISNEILLHKIVYILHFETHNFNNNEPLSIIHNP